VDATLLLHGHPSEARLGMLGTPAALALLDLTAVGDPGAAESVAQARERIASLLATRRASSPAPQPAVGASGRTLSAVCTAWEDPRWVSSTRAALRDGSGLDYYARSETAWRDGQLWLALRTLGALRPNARVLLLGAPSEGLIAALSQVVAEITIADHESPAVSGVQGLARRPLGKATIVGRAWPTMRTEQARFDLVVAPNLSAYTSARDLEATLTALAAHVAPAGVVAVGLSVRIAGPADGQWVETADCADDSMLRRAGLQRVGPFQSHVADETLLAAVPSDAPHTSRPRLARAIGAHVLTFATLVLRPAA
jgi:hypothetical protein